MSRRATTAAKPTPLVISMHGGGMWPAAQMDTSQWNRVAERARVHRRLPVGNRGRRPRAWRAGHGADLMTDVRFISELIDTLKAAYNIDPARIYANGLSNGGGMAFVLSCTLSDRIAAVGMVAAAALTAVELVYGPSAGADDRVSWDRRSVDSVPRRDVVGRSASRFPTSRPGRRIGREETGADRTRSTPWSLRMSPASNTRTVPTTRPWCSTPSREEATPGPAAGRCRNGSPGPPATASTPRARCGRSFVSIGFERRRPRRGTSKVVALKSALAVARGRVRQHRRSTVANSCGHAGNCAARLQILRPDHGPAFVTVLLCSSLIGVGKVCQIGGYSVGAGASSSRSATSSATSSPRSTATRARAA